MLLLIKYNLRETEAVIGVPKAFPRRGDVGTSPSERFSLGNRLQAF